MDWIKQVQDGIQNIADNNKLKGFDCLVVIAHQEECEDKGNNNTSHMVFGNRLGIIVNIASFFAKNPDMINVFEQAIALSKITLHPQHGNSWLALKEKTR